MEIFRGYQTSSSQAPLSVGASSSRAPSSIAMTNALQNGVGTTLRLVSNEPARLLNERESGHPRPANRDPKQLKRIANRLSARRSRERKLEHKTELERKEKCLEEKIALLNIRKEEMTHKNKLLHIERKNLEKRMYHLAWKSKIRERQIQKTNAEIMEIIKFRTLERQKIVKEPDLTLSLALPGIHAK